jgi:hypothetical protein
VNTHKDAVRIQILGLCDQASEMSLAVSRLIDKADAPHAAIAHILNFLDSKHFSINAEPAILHQRLEHCQFFVSQRPGTITVEAL